MSGGTFALDLPRRTRKPRDHGLSNLVDSGYGLANLRDVLSVTAPYVDIVKLGWASAYITSNLAEKVALYRDFDIRVCFGGVMFELSWWQNKAEDYAHWLQDLGVDLVEVSNGSLPIDEADKRRMIAFYERRGFTVLSEVGSKDVQVVSPPERWIECIAADLESGAWKVITEGRADASAGIYMPDARPRDSLIDAILDSGLPSEALIFEAPHKAQMSYFIKRVGSNVNLGNIPLGEVLNLETLRLGLRGDTIEHFHAKPS